MADQQDGGEREPQPIDEEAAWAAIVAGYGEEPADPPGARPYRPIETLSLPEPEDEDEAGGGNVGPAKPGTGTWKSEGGLRKPAAGDSGPGTGSAADPAADTAPDAAADAAPDAGAETAPDDRPEAGTGKPALGSSVVFAPGVRPTGPRDYTPAEPEDGPGGSDEGHFVPPEPPPLPEADATTKFAWLGVVGGPVLMLLAVLLQWDMTWWLTTVCVGGFLGGFATLVARMKHDDEDDDGFDDPGRGAVV
ncbi:hypothetical protein AB0G79_08200 [Streptomyces sp. NPDC020807]|uniref:hypothetical protein n=1 Tax=Streptomyces sp. NPDC020807 TaxID=3155119 RepID=UPI0033E12F92